jgi:hypothetical protein
MAAGIDNVCRQATFPSGGFFVPAKNFLWPVSEILFYYVNNKISF